MTSLFKVLTAPYNRYGKVANSYDALKTFALITMIIDHLGYYGLVPDYMRETMRLIGRLSCPVWLFLVGYSRSDKLAISLLVSGVFLEVLEFSLLGKLTKLNILFTILAVRLILKYLPENWWKKRVFTAVLVVVSIVLYMPTKQFIDYGTLAIAFAILGRVQRENRDFYWPLALLIAGSYTVLMYIGFQFSLADTFLLGTMMVGLYAILYHFKIEPIAVYGTVSNRLLKGLGRYALHYYVLHIAAFMLIANYIYK